MKRSKLIARQEGHYKWLPLERREHVPLTEEQIRDHVRVHLRHHPHLTEAAVRASIADLANDELWKNDRYQVNLRKIIGNGSLPTLVHLSIRRIDRKPVRDWRDMQRIKNQLVGPENEGIELFPAESRLVDTANSFHIWVVDDPTFKFPFGFHEGRYVQSENIGGGQQRPLDEE